MVYYLKYRPQKIADLDLPEIREGLGKLIKSAKVPHALLFSGPRGSGKTSAARIIAKAVNCLKNKGKDEPCNRCAVCEEVTKGSLVDLIEIDGASNRGIDDVRNLKEKIKLAPAQARKKAYIIDEVHMLTTEAFNALLKTLEEPPEHAIFILCTTTPGKLPETIVSRCLNFRFRKAKPQEVEASLKKVVKGEKLKVEEGVLRAIVKNVDGDFREAKKILDQLAAGTEKISLAETKKLLGQIESFSPLGLIKSLIKRDLKAGLLEINRLVESGADLKDYLQSFLETLRRILVSRIGVGEFKEPEETKNLTTTGIKVMIQSFSQVTLELKNAVIPQLPLEMAVIEWGQEGADDDQEKKAGGSQASSPAPGNDSRELKEIQNLWPEVLSKVKPLNHSVEALLRACRPLEVNGEVLTLEVFYRFHKESLETEKCRNLIEEAAENVLGSPVKIRCILGERKENLSASPAKPKAVPKERSEGLPADLLSAAEEIFSGKVIE